MFFYKIVGIKGFFIIKLRQPGSAPPPIRTLRHMHCTAYKMFLALTLTERSKTAPECFLKYSFVMQTDIL